ncbi:MAG: arsenate reductase (glutaredoxin), partial [Hyphomonadaceae bacterium]
MALMAKKGDVTIYHNPNCSTSRQVLEMIVAAGYKPTIVEYLKVGWTKTKLRALFVAAGVTPREALRRRQKEAEDLGLLDDAVTDAQILEAMVANPVLVERPFITTSKGTMLARP